MQVTTLGIDLAKNVFQVHGVDAQGRQVFSKALRRSQLRNFVAQLPACRIGMEACGSAHYWARELQALGHEVRLMAPQFVKPYVKTNKNDRADAEAICEAVTRPNMRFVPIKTPDQQAVLALHRVREGQIKARTAQANQVRGLLAEFGIVVPQGMTTLFRELPGILEDAENGLPDLFRTLLADRLDELRRLDQAVKEQERQIQAWHRSHAVSRRLAEIPGIGPISATALVAAIGHARYFKNGRQLAAWMGLVPKQHSSGGQSNLLGISKRGDRYLRMLLIHGARSALLADQRRGEGGDPWLEGLRQRRCSNVATVALANKNARTVWALMAHDRTFDPGLRGAAA